MKAESHENFNCQAKLQTGWGGIPGIFGGSSFLGGPSPVGWRRARCGGATTADVGYTSNLSSTTMPAVEPNQPRPHVD
jgi:hypothetical protein